MVNIIQKDAEEICEKVDFSCLKGKTILISGASGLIGGYLLLCLKLVSKSISGINVIAVFRSDLPNYIITSEFENLHIYKGDITEVSFCQSLPLADFIVHAAGYGQPIKFMQAPEKTLKLNTFSTFLLFDRLNSGGSFLFVSSSEVYSGLNADIYSESQIGNTNTTHPRACYIEGKRGGEAICNAFKIQGVKASSVRLGHTYGPGTKEGDKRVILSFIEKAMNGKIEMLDKGEAVRTYCYISDAVEIIWSILFSCKEPIYNLGGTSRTSIAGLADCIGEIMNVSVSLPETINSVAGAPEDVRLDMSKVESEFSKTTYVDLKEGLQRTISWYLNKN